MMATVQNAMIAAAFTALTLSQTTTAQTSWTVASPDGRIQIKISLIDSAGKTRLGYEIACDKQTVVSPSPLGIVRRDQSLGEGLKFVGAGTVKTIDETYTMLTGKRKTCRNFANEQTLVFQNPGGARIELIVRAYNDGAAFR